MPDSTPSNNNFHLHYPSLKYCIQMSLECARYPTTREAATGRSSDTTTTLSRQAYSYSRQIMVLVSDGNLEHVHLQDGIRNLICLIYLFRSTAVANFKYLIINVFFFINKCATCLRHHLIYIPWTYYSSLLLCRA